MAEERQDVRVLWERAGDYRLIQPSGGSATAVDFGQGPVVLRHLTTNTVVLKGETVPSVVDTARGLTTQVGPGKFDQETIKLLEATVHLPADVAGSFVPLLLKGWDGFRPDTKRKVRDALAGLPRE